MKKIKENSICLLIFALISVIILMQSPLNPISKTVSTSDSAVFLCGGNLIREGKILYKDFFDHKGPMLYIIEVVGLSIANGNTIGVWILEIIFMLISLCLLYKISRLFSKNKIINCISTIISIMPICFFLEGGNFVEEYALPFILYSLYIFIKYMQNGEVKYREIFLNGLSLSFVIFLRPNMISLWIVFVPIVIAKFIKDKKYKELAKTIGMFLAGMLVVALPTLIYFLVNGAFSDFIYAFLEFNFKYAGFSEEVQGKTSTIEYFIVNIKLDIIICIILIANTIRLKLNKEKYARQIILLTYFVLSLVLLSVSGRMYPHYGIILIPCYIIPVTELMEYIINLKNKKIKIGSLIVLTIIMVGISISPIKNQINKTKENFIENLNINMDIVNYVRENSTEDDNVFILGNNCNIYNATNRRYQGKYIYQVPIIIIDAKISDEIINQLEENKPEIIIYAADAYSFNLQKYTTPEKLYASIKGEEDTEGLLNNEEFYNMLTKYLKKIKNISRVYEKIETMAEEGIYTKTVTDKYIFWKLNKN